MSGERFQRIDGLFRRALRLPPDEREVFLEEQRRGDPSLKADVVALLAEDDAARGVLDQPALGAEFDLRALTIEAGEDAPLPARIGTYRIVALLGAGGMGTVYEAEQDEPRRRVALKVIRTGVSRNLLRRFRHEAQVLGQLTHPGIARIYEAATADDGEGGKPTPSPANG